MENEILTQQELEKNYSVALQQAHKEFLLEEQSLLDSHNELKQQLTKKRSAATEAARVLSSNVRSRLATQKCTWLEKRALAAPTEVLEAEKLWVKQRAEADNELARIHSDKLKEYDRCTAERQQADREYGVALRGARIRYNDRKQELKEEMRRGIAEFREYVAEKESAAQAETAKTEAAAQHGIIIEDTPAYGN